MSLCGTDMDKKRLITRLHRIEGQIRGLCKMIEGDEDCINVLRQISSVSGAVKGVWMQVLEEHLSGCISRAADDEDHHKELISELVEHLKKIT